MIGVKSIICLFSILCFGHREQWPLIDSKCQVYSYNQEMKSLICPDNGIKSPQLNEINMSVLALTGSLAPDQYKLCELNFKHLIIQRAALPDLTPLVTLCNKFKKSKSHHTLTIKSSTNVDAWTWSSFNFKHIYIADSFFGKTAPGTLHTLSFLPDNIYSLSLINCHMSRFDDGVFAIYDLLRTIVIQHNQMTSFSRSVLPKPANYLWYIDLSYNRIANLDGNFFEGLPILKEFNLQGNQLIQLTWDHVKFVFTSLHLLNIQDNQLKCSNFCWAYNEQFANNRPALFDWTNCITKANSDEILLGTLTPVQCESEKESDNDD